MRQAGVLAACGVVSLNSMVDRLAQDHANARRLAAEICDLPGVSVDLGSVETNMVLVNTDFPAEGWQAKLAAEGLLCFAVAAHRLRLVFHADVDEAKTSRAVEVFRGCSG